MSTALLADTGIFKKISTSFQSRVSQNFQNALEVAQRVDEGELLQTVQQLQTVLDAHDELKTMIRYYAVTKATSVDTQWQLLTAAIFKMLKSSVTLSRSLHARLENVYNRYVDYLVTDVTSAMQSADDLYAQLTKAFLTNGDADTNQIDSLVLQLKYVREKLENFDTDLNTTTAFTKELFPKQLVSSTTCNTAKQSLNSTSDKQLKWLEGYPDESKYVAADYLKDSSDVRVQLARTADCMKQYKVDLDNFSKWLDSVQLPQFASSELTSSQSDAVDTDGTKLRDILRTFVDGSLTKSEMATQYLAKVDKMIETNANRLVSDVKESVFSKLNANIDTFKQFMETFFSELFKMYVNLQKYMKSTDKTISTVARKHEIWRKPAVNFQSSSVSFSIRFH